MTAFGRPAKRQDDRYGRTATTTMRGRMTAFGIGGLVHSCLVRARCSRSAARGGTSANHPCRPFVRTRANGSCRPFADIQARQPNGKDRPKAALPLSDIEQRNTGCSFVEAGPTCTTNCRRRDTQVAGASAPATVSVQDAKCLRVEAHGLVLVGSVLDDDHAAHEIDRDDRDRRARLAVLGHLVVVE